MEIPFPSSLTAFSLLIFFISMVVKEWRKFKNASLNLPPGPKKLPFIGNFVQLVCSGSLPHHALKNLADKHGPIMHLRLGELSTIVISSARGAEQVYKTHDLTFSDRPRLLLTKIVFYDSSDVGFAPYGEHWRQMRKLCVTELLGPRKVQSFHNIIKDEVSHLIKSIQSSQGQIIDLTDMVLSVHSAILCRATVGRRCKDQESLMKYAREAVSYASTFNVGDAFPSLTLLDSLFGSKRKLEKLHKKVDEILEDIIRKHEENRVRTTGGTEIGDEQLVEEDLLDVFLRLKERNDPQCAVTYDNIKANIFELYAAGMDTSATVVEWTMAAMIKHPRAMEMAQAEVRQFFKGKNGIENHSDLQKLSYLKMVIKETLRLYPVAPLLVPRLSREPCKIDGYDIPKNTITIVNNWAIGRDAESWEDAEKFEPERFSKILTNFSGSQFEFIPFGAGRRICPGINFSMAVNELILAQLLFHFDWNIPGGVTPEEFDMSEQFGAVAIRKNKLELIATSYVPE